MNLEQVYNFLCRIFGTRSSGERYKAAGKSLPKFLEVQG